MKRTSPNNCQYNTNNKNMRSDERHEQIITSRSLQPDRRYEKKAAPQTKRNAAPNKESNKAKKQASFVRIEKYNAI